MLSVGLFLLSRISVYIPGMKWRVVEGEQPGITILWRAVPPGRLAFTIAFGGVCCGIDTGSGMSIRYLRIIGFGPLGWIGSWGGTWGVLHSVSSWK